MSQNFDEYLKNENSQYKYKKIALTAKSYKNVDHNLTNKDTNCNLATYGDALLKLALCRILFESDVSNITIDKEDYESDKVLVEVIARNYDLLKKINFDKNDVNLPRDYDYKKDTYKYIATTVEALLAAYYLDCCNKDFELVLKIVEEWKNQIDSAHEK